MSHLFSGACTSIALEELHLFQLEILRLLMDTQMHFGAGEERIPTSHGGKGMLHSISNNVISLPNLKR